MVWLLSHRYRVDIIASVYYVDTLPLVRVIFIRYLNYNNFVTVETHMTIKAFKYLFN